MYCSCCRERAGKLNWPWSVIELLLLQTVRWLLNGFVRGEPERKTCMPALGRQRTHRTGCTHSYLLLVYEPNINENDTLPDRENSSCISPSHFNVVPSLQADVLFIIKYLDKDNETWRQGWPMALSEIVRLEADCDMSHSIDSGRVSLPFLTSIPYFKLKNYNTDINTMYFI